MATAAALKQRNQKATQQKDSSRENSLDSHLYDPKKVHSAFSGTKTVLGAWARLLAFIAMLVLITYRLHYTLPTAVVEGTNPTTGQAQFSEENVRKIVRHLSSDIGYRVVGTEQELEAKQYLINRLETLKEEARIEGLRREQDLAPLPNFDMWVQVGDGSHRFDFMSKAHFLAGVNLQQFSLEHQDNAIPSYSLPFLRNNNRFSLTYKAYTHWKFVVMKMYTNMTNIIVRLSCGPECDQNSILLNSHYDTTLGSPGAVDDGLGVGVMMEVLRVMSRRPAPKKNSIIFLFNGGEESLQDASHSFITSHELKDNVRAVVNLEACGTAGPEILFQANSRPMIDAYGTVPYPHGTVLANDLFATGLILSDTDFRQFVDHGNLTGLDMAVYKNSYLYHTHLDLDEYMESGLPQHMGENTLALSTYLTEKADLVNLEKTDDVVFFDFFGFFFVTYSWSMALLLHASIGGLFLFSIATGASRPTVRSTISMFLTFVAALFTPIISVILLEALGKPMQWFSHEWLAVLHFAPMAFVGMLTIQYLFHDKKASTGANELSTYSALQVFFTVLLGLVTYARRAGSYVFAIYSLGITIGLFFNQKRTAIAKAEGFEIQRVDYASYFVGTLIPTAYFSFCTFSLLDLFVPLTGRIGADAPVDHIVAILIGFIAFVFSPPVLAFAHRFGAAVLRKIIVFLLIGQLVFLLISTISLTPYNELHPKRVFVQHLRNLTSGASQLYVAHADPGPFYEPYVTQLETLFSTESVFRSPVNNPGDWNAIYPFNQFLESHVIDTAPYIKSQTANKTIANSQAPLTDFIHSAPRLIAENVSYDPETGLRRLTVLCTHPDYIWTVAGFDAHLESWSLTSSEPFPHPSHYVIRHVGGHMSDGWRVDLAYRASGPDDKLMVELTAMETEGFGKDTERELIGSGDIGVMRSVLKTRPPWVALTYFGTTVSRFHL
ncbi:hypothetical protein BGW38_002104 [Lunasporangiospora selenospora]|uniref:Peptide hydrolase n=1 Tax=Lunasporangiospora selenospora TaxID=979761 RepID=A0A9P6FSI5_9FUNG|nr:hypothetical protein BGW38_002104 [Lunasporangiospora selenospora]